MTTVPDLLRLVAVPVLGWAAYRDIKIRRVPNKTWYPLALIAVLALAWEGMAVYDAGALQFRAFWIRVALSVGLLVPIGYGFWWFGGIGGADAKAMFVLAVLFPTYPLYTLDLGAQTWLFPLTTTRVGVFSMTVLTNTVLLGVAFPVMLGVRNLLRGELSWRAFVATRRPWDELDRRHGRLMQTADGRAKRGLDLDALRMYCRWRRTDLETLRAERERFRDPDSIPDERGVPTDGAVAAGSSGGTVSGGLLPDGGEVMGSADEATGSADDEADSADEAAGSANDEADSADEAADSADNGATDATTDDPWGAEAFLTDLEHGAYGTTPETLRDGLEVVTTEDEVWYTPGIPFIVPMFVGLVVGLVYGDLLFGLLQWIALL